MTARADAEEKGGFLEDEDPMRHNLISKVDSLNGRLSSRTDDSWTWLPRSQVPWILSTSISISTTRWILVTYHFHFPVLLLVWQAAAAILFLSLNVFLRKRLNHPEERRDTGIGFPITFRSLVSLCLAAGALPVFNQAILHFTNIASLVLFSIHTLSVVELLYVLGALLGGLFGARQRSSLTTFIYVIRASICVAITHFILTKDYRRSSRGDRSLLVASYLTAFSQWILNSSTRKDSRSRKMAPDHYQLLLAIAAMVSGLIWYFAHEGPYTSVQMPSFLLLLVNLISTANAIISGGSLLIPLTATLEQDTQESNYFSNSLRLRVVSIFSVAGIVALMSLLLPQRGYINVFQLLVFALTFWLLFLGSSSSGKKSSIGGIFRLNNINRNLTILAFLCWAAYIPMNFTDFPFTPPQPILHPSLDRNYRITKRFEIVIAYYDEPVAEMVNMVTTITSVPTIQALNPRVIFYTKDEKLNTTAFRASLTKKFAADPRNKKKFLIANSLTSHPTMVIEPLWNLGREAGTYLHHIANKWHSLAQHTLFTQATMHDLDHIVERLQYFVPGPPISPLPKESSGVMGYFRGSGNQAAKLKDLWKNVDTKLKNFNHKTEQNPSPHDVKEQSASKSPKEENPASAATLAKPKKPSKFGRSTGMLPLGFETEVCDCHRCSDTWGWFDTSHLIALMYNKVYGLPKPQCKDVLLTYKGAFIVSGQRIRGIDRMTYVFYRNGLTVDDRWEHTREYLEKYTGHGGINAGADSTQRWGEKNSLQRPWFGYTMERMWGMLFQCNDMGIAWKCPTFRSGWRSSFPGINGGADLGDCQCFDHISPPDK